MPDHDDINLDLPGVGDPPQTDQSAETVTAAAPIATAEPLEDVETLATELAIPAWELAGLMRHQRWAAGKAVTRTALAAALAAFEGRPLGGGR